MHTIDGQRRFLAVYASTPCLLSRATLEMLFGERTDIDLVETAGATIWAVETAAPDVIILDGRGLPNALGLVYWLRRQPRLEGTQIGVIQADVGNAADRADLRLRLMHAGADLVVDANLGRFELLKRLVLLRPDVTMSVAN